MPDSNTATITHLGYLRLRPMQPLVICGTRNRDRPRQLGLSVASRSASGDYYPYPLGWLALVSDQVCYGLVALLVFWCRTQMERPRHRSGWYEVCPWGGLPTAWKVAPAVPRASAPLPPAAGPRPSPGRTRK